MNVLLIGGTGVLSRDISQKILSKGMNLYMLNRGNRPSEILDKTTLIKANIRNVDDVKEKIEGLRFDVVVDFLSFNPSQLEISLSIFAETCGQYIFISSATAYSVDKREEPITENVEMGNRLWGYADGKAKCEAALREYSEKTGLAYTIVRPYVTYGDTRIPFAVISGRRKWSLVHRILQGKPVVMWDNGSAICTLTHTIDFAVGIVGLFGNAKAKNQAFHITSDERFTWNEVLQIIARAVGREANVVNIPSTFIENEMSEYKGLLLGDKATNMTFNNAKIKEAVPEFNCIIGFEEGIRRAIAYHRNHPEWMGVDYVWDAQIDRLIIKYQKEVGSTQIKHNQLKYISGGDRSLRDWFVYEATRRSWLNYGVKIVRRLKRM